MSTIQKIRKAIKAEFPEVDIHRSPHGYYYFSNESKTDWREIRSLYFWSVNIHGDVVEEKIMVNKVLDHVRSELAN